MFEDFWGSSGEFAIVGSHPGGAPTAGPTINPGLGTERIDITQPRPIGAKVRIGAQGWFDWSITMLNPLEKQTWVDTIAMVNSFGAGFGWGMITSMTSMWVGGLVSEAFGPVWGLLAGVATGAVMSWAGSELNDWFMMQWDDTPSWQGRVVSQQGFYAGEFLGGAYYAYLNAAELLEGVAAGAMDTLAAPVQVGQGVANYIYGPPSDVGSIAPGAAAVGPMGDPRITQPDYWDTFFEDAWRALNGVAPGF